MSRAVWAPLSVCQLDRVAEAAYRLFRVLREKHAHVLRQHPGEETLGQFQQTLLSQPHPQRCWGRFVRHGELGRDFGYVSPSAAECELVLGVTPFEYCA